MVKGKGRTNQKVENLRPPVLFVREATQRIRISLLGRYPPRIDRASHSHDTHCHHFVLEKVDVYAFRNMCMVQKRIALHWEREKVHVIRGTYRSQIVQRGSSPKQWMNKFFACNVERRKWSRNFRNVQRGPHFPPFVPTRQGITNLTNGKVLDWVQILLGTNGFP
jgi:hypothetical protein